MKPPYYAYDSQDLSIHINIDDILNWDPFYVYYKFKVKGIQCYAKYYYQLYTFAIQTRAGEPDDHYCTCLSPTQCSPISISGSVKWVI